MSEVLKGLYARRDAIKAKIGDRVMSLSRLGSALMPDDDEFPDDAIHDLHQSLQAVEAQITAYQRSAA